MTELNVLGVSVQRMTQKVALETLLSAVEERTSLSVAFANANLLNMSYRDPSLCRALKRTFMLNDGVGINAAAKYLSDAPFPTNLNGTDFMPLFLEAAPAGLRVYLLGGLPEVNRGTVEYFAARWPQHRIVGAQHGYLGEDDAERLLAEVEASSAQVVIIAMGNGKQEKLACRIAERMPTVAFSVGALFDFWTERHPRAPLWMRQGGAEWVYRLWREPGRMWRRYLVGNPVFLGRVWLQARRSRRAGNLGFVDTKAITSGSSLQLDESSSVTPSA